ncbi:UNKNOWN [Stylonychia lemnae]|uniref:Uncharacterized protein n=1 Tax=Stylonychia lemnae TaxID=5949 RepID=A0A078A4K5_STYLE|nr:UNKNOWN [Stylonychia lemnae]|eukprot:CDW76428.1 UNKNOWN [Stylonychia lemnae]
MLQNSSSEITQPLLDGYNKPDKKSNEFQDIVPTDYQWILDKYQEVDYSKEESRIQKTLIKIEGKIEQIFILEHKNLIICKRDNSFLDVVKKDSSQLIKTVQIYQGSNITYQVYDNADYIMFQIQNGNIYLYKLEEFEKEAGNHLIELQFEQPSLFKYSSIQSQFDVLVTLYDEIILFRLDKNINVFEVDYANQSQFYVKKYVYSRHQIFFKDQLDDVFRFE